jgi:diamine N-acetyltransferase
MAQPIGLTDGIISLRALEPGDLDLLYRWENDFEQWATTAATSPMSRHQLWQYIQNYDADIFAAKQIRFVIVESDSDKQVGTIDVFDFSPADRRAYVGIYIAEEYREKHYGLKALALLERYATEAIGMHQLVALTSVRNDASLALFKTAGFKSCGKLHSWLRRSGGVYEDVIIWQKLFK